MLSTPPPTLLRPHARSDTSTQTYTHTTYTHALNAEEEEEEESSDSGVSFFSDTESVAAVKLNKKKVIEERQKAAERAKQEAERKKAEAEQKKARRRADLDSLSSLGLSFSSSELGEPSPPERKK